MKPDFAAAQLAEARQLLEDVRAELQNHALLPAWQRKIRAFLSYAAPSPETGTAGVATRRPLDKAAEWARMSGVDPRDPGPAPEPVKPPAAFVFQQCSRCQDEGWISVPDGGELMGMRAVRCPVGCPDEIERARTPAAGTAPKGEG